MKKNFKKKDVVVVTGSPLGDKVDCPYIGSLALVCAWDDGYLLIELQFITIYNKNNIGKESPIIFSISPDKIEKIGVL